MPTSVQVTAFNAPFAIVDVPIPEPGPGQVRVRVHACGVCHSDVLTVGGFWPGVAVPRAPGHEVAGVIDKLGEGVRRWSVGDRVGVGWFGGVDLDCDSCRSGDFMTCENFQVSGIHFDGGYGDYMIVQAFALAKIPDALDFAEAGPLLCAGVTTFNALRHSGARAGDLVAIHGIGGLGHLGVQYAAKMGFRTVAIARGADKAAFAHELGAHEYIDSAAGDPAAALQKLGGARVILTTVTDGAAMSAVLGGLGRDGKLLVVGAAADPVAVPPFALIGARRSVAGWPSGTAKDSEETLAFSAQTGVRPMIEKMPLAQAQNAFDKMMSGKARFRMVLETGA
jgi:D-arabinose 1-dehydrogenase-like Zn-dependent alcohol dehydrogenase